MVIRSWPASVTCDKCGRRSPRVPSSRLMVSLRGLGWSVDGGDDVHRPALLCPSCHGERIKRAMNIGGIDAATRTFRLSRQRDKAT